MLADRAVGATNTARAALDGGDLRAAWRVPGLMGGRGGRPDLSEDYSAGAAGATSHVTRTHVHRGRCGDPERSPQTCEIGLLCRFRGWVRGCCAACGAVPPRSRAPSASLRDAAPRHPGPASLHGPSGQGYGQARGLPSTTRSTPEPTKDQVRCGIALFPQVTQLDRPARTIMKPHPRKRQ